MRQYPAADARSGTGNRQLDDAGGEPWSILARRADPKNIGLVETKRRAGNTGATLRTAAITGRNVKPLQCDCPRFHNIRCRDRRRIVYNGGSYRESRAIDA